MLLGIQAQPPGVRQDLLGERREQVVAAVLGARGEDALRRRGSRDPWPAVLETPRFRPTANEP